MIRISAAGDVQSRIGSCPEESLQAGNPVGLTSIEPQV